MSEAAIGIGLIGCGTVGQGVARLLDELGAVYAERMGRAVELRKVLVRDTSKPRDGVDASLLTDDVAGFFATEAIDIVVEVAGGIDPVRGYVTRALEAGKHVVTANKALLAAHGPELYALARKHQVSIAFEASCGGGVPIITAMQFNLLGNQISGMYGILNGTCNYILTQMTKAGKSYETALAEAQEAGFAEADPTLDVNGGDTASKLAILASLAFGVAASDEHVITKGIDDLDLADIQYGGELGYEMKLLALAEQTEAGLSLRVNPCFVDKDEALAQVSGSFNAVSVYGHAVGHTMYYGRGAGQMPTASAVVGDLLSVVSGAYPAAFLNSRVWPDLHETVTPIDPDTLEARYYLRLTVRNEPGVMAQFTKSLGDQGISIAAVIQHEMDEHGWVPVVIVTHRAPDGALRRAADSIAALEHVAGDPVCIRIIDMPEG